MVYFRLDLKLSRMEQDLTCTVYGVGDCSLVLGQQLKKLGLLLLRGMSGRLKEVAERMT